MDKFTLHVKRHDNGCRVDLVHTDTEYDDDVDHPVEVQKEILFSSDGNVSGFTIAFHTEDDMEGYSNDPAISFHKVDDDENPH